MLTQSGGPFNAAAAAAAVAPSKQPQTVLIYVRFYVPKLSDLVRGHFFNSGGLCPMVLVLPVGDDVVFSTCCGGRKKGRNEDVVVTPTSRKSRPEKAREEA
jgi:hypothetical protein